MISAEPRWASASATRTASAIAASAQVSAGRSPATGSCSVPEPEAIDDQQHDQGGLGEAGDRPEQPQRHHPPARVLGSERDASPPGARALDRSRPRSAGAGFAGDLVAAGGFPAHDAEVTDGSAAGPPEEPSGAGDGSGRDGCPGTRAAPSSTRAPDGCARSAAGARLAQQKQRVRAQSAEQTPPVAVDVGGGGDRPVLDARAADRPRRASRSGQPGEWGNSRMRSQSDRRRVAPPLPRRGASDERYRAAVSGQRGAGARRCSCYRHSRSRCSERGSPSASGAPAARLRGRTAGSPSAAWSSRRTRRAGSRAGSSP